MNETFEFTDSLPTLNAGAVTLRWLTEADIPDLFTIFGDEEVTRYWGFGRLTDEAAAATLLRSIHDGFHSRTLFQWGIEAEGAVVGTCTLSSIDLVNRRAELGFAIGRQHWGRGYAAPAVRAVLDFAFDTLALHRVYADTDPRNTRSMHRLEQLGFVREGHLREHYLVAGEPQDAVVYGLLRSGWSLMERG